MHDERQIDPRFVTESQDLIIGRITLHQKTVWMQKSFLK